MSKSIGTHSYDYTEFLGVNNTPTHQKAQGSQGVQDYNSNEGKIKMTEKENKMRVDKPIGLPQVTHTDNLVAGGFYTLVRANRLSSDIAYMYDVQQKVFIPINIDMRNQGYEIKIEDIIDNDHIKVYTGFVRDEVTINGRRNSTSFKIDEVKVKYKEYEETVPLLDLSWASCTPSVFDAIVESTKAYYLEMLNKNPEIVIIGECEYSHSNDVSHIAEDTLNIDESTPEERSKVHQDIILMYNKIMEETSAVSRTINESTKLEDIQGIQEAFIKTRDKLQEYSKSTLRSQNKFISGLQSLPWVGKAIDMTRETISNTKSVQENIDALFISMHKQYEKLVEIGTGLQEAKAKQESQLVRLETLIEASDGLLAKYGAQVNVPIKELSDNNQIKTSYERIKRRILKTEAAIMGTQASILTLGKTLPSDKAEMTEELSLNGLLDSLSDYQGMYTAISGFLNEVVTATSEKTYAVVENLMDMQINDTKALEYLEKDTVQSKKFALMLTDKANRLADKSRRDAVFIESVAKGTSILEARQTIKSLGYITEIKK